MVQQFFSSAKPGLKVVDNYPVLRYNLLKSESSVFTQRKVGEYMSLEAIKQITDTELSCQQEKQEAAIAAQKLLIDAEREGKSHLEAAIAQGEAEARILLKEAEAKAGNYSEELLKEAESKCDLLKTAAEKKLEKAVSIIVERVVSV